MLQCPNSRLGPGGDEADDDVWLGVIRFRLRLPNALVDCRLTR